MNHLQACAFGTHVQESKRHRATPKVDSFNFPVPRNHREAEAQGAGFLVLRWGSRWSSILPSASWRCPVSPAAHLLLVQPQRALPQPAGRPEELQLHHLPAGLGAQEEEPGGGRRLMCGEGGASFFLGGGWGAICFDACKKVNRSHCYAT